MRKPPLLHYAESYNDPDQYWLSGFLAPDPFWTVWREGMRPLLIVCRMEAGRARKECRGQVMTEEEVHPQRQVAKGLAAHMLRARGKAEARVLPSFPLGMARALEQEGVALSVERDVIRARRRRKGAREIAAVRSVQRRLEKGFLLVRDILAGCEVRKGNLWSAGRPLRAEELRRTVEAFLLGEGLECSDSIVAPGPGAADPHWRGEGVIRAGEAVVVDLFPRDRLTRYHSDMTRTFAVGKPKAAIVRMHDAVRTAQDAAFRSLRVGGRLDKVHGAVCRVFSRRGYPALGVGKVSTRGFIHSTGHGVGLAIHEPPSLAPLWPYVLEPGDIVTIEPGLYDPRVGGVRIEDIVAVTPGGRIERLTDFPRDLIVG